MIIIFLIIGVESCHSSFNEFHEIIFPQVGAVLTNKELAVNSLTDAYIALRSNLNLKTPHPSEENCTE